MMPPFTLFLLVVAPMIAPAAAPMAASRCVCFTVVVGWAAGVVLLELPVLPTLPDVPGFEALLPLVLEWCVVLVWVVVLCVAAGAAAAVAAVAAPARSAADTESIDVAAGAARERLSAFAPASAGALLQAAVSTIAATGINEEIRMGARSGSMSGWRQGCGQQEACGGRGLFEHSFDSLASSIGNGILIPPPSVTRAHRLRHRDPAPSRARFVRRVDALGVVALAVGALACSGSRAPDAGGDTALARDLAIVQMETNRARDSAADALAHAASTPPSAIDSSADSSAGSATLPPPVPVDTPTVAARTQVAADTPIHAVHRPSDPCDSPEHDSQLACLRRKLAEYDAPLNRVYQRYIDRLRAAPANRGGGAPAINKLRESQRAWLTYRDQMCARRLKGKEPKLWAPGRAACLGEYATARAKLLNDMLNGAR